MANEVAVRKMNPGEAGALAEMASAEIDSQVQTAKRFPRDLAECRASLLELSTSSDAVAESCLYSLERKDKEAGIKYIVGPSIRFAELLVYSWGNIRWGARILEEGREFITALGFCHDLQRNTATAIEVKRRITTSAGHRYGVDMIGVAGAAASSIAQRNAAFDTIPEAVWRPIWDRSREVAVGNQQQLRTRVDAAISFFVKAGASEKMIYPALGVKNRGELTLDHVAMMIGLRNAVKDNLIPIDRLFHPEAHEERAMLGLTAAPTIDQREALKSRGAGKAGGGGAVSSAGPSPDSSAGAADKGKGKGKATKADTAAPAEEQAPAQAATEGAPVADAKPAADGPTPDPAADAGPSEAETLAEDETIVAGVESQLLPGKALSNRKAVDEARGALSRIAVMGVDGLRERAELILKEYPAQ